MWNSNFTELLPKEQTDVLYHLLSTGVVLGKPGNNASADCGSGDGSGSQPRVGQQSVSSGEGGRDRLTRGVTVKTGRHRKPDSHWRSRDHSSRGPKALETPFCLTPSLIKWGAGGWEGSRRY